MIHLNNFKTSKQNKAFLLLAVSVSFKNKITEIRNTEHSHNVSSANLNEEISQNQNSNTAKPFFTKITNPSNSTKLFQNAYLKICHLSKNIDDLRPKKRWINQKIMV